jgi:hypothetical protein
LRADITNMTECKQKSIIFKVFLANYFRFLESTSHVGTEKAVACSFTGWTSRKSAYPSLASPTYIVFDLSPSSPLLSPLSPVSSFGACEMRMVTEYTSPDDSNTVYYLNLRTFI